MAESGPDELYTLRAQFALGHYALAVQEAKTTSRRPMSAALKVEREEYLMRAYTALRQYDKCIADPGDGAGLQALALKAQYEAAVGDESKQRAILDQVKTLAGTGEPGATAQLAAAQVCLAAGETGAAFPFCATPTTPELTACKLQILLKLDRLDLAKKELQSLQKESEESILAELCSVYIHLAAGSSTAGEAEHTLSSLSEQYGPSVYLLNLLAVALSLQGDYAAAETKLQECLRDFSEVQPQHDTLINLVSVYQQQNKAAEAAAIAQEILATVTPTASSLNFTEGLERVTTAFDRETAKYKV